MSRCQSVRTKVTTLLISANTRFMLGPSLEYDF